MTDNTSLVNLALQSFGSRTTVTAAELAANSTNEAIQANLTFDNTRDSLLRMAPWDCGLKTANLIYITSVPGTMQNSSAAPALWQPGLPRPPWAYEYQYPSDCLRACWIIPASQTGFTGVPITTAVTGNTPTTWLGGPIVFKVGIDQFYVINAMAVVAGGTGYTVGEIVTLPLIPNTSIINIGGGQSLPVGQPQGAPPQIRVLTVDGAGAILTFAIIPQVVDTVPPTSGSLFYGYTGTITGATSNRLGTGATFTATAASDQVDQRVILTNQEFATLCYVRRVTDPNVWDPLFQDAFQNSLGADLCMALNGDKGLANACISRANNSIAQARTADSNEGLTINDVVPDWIRIRGVNFDSQYLGGGNAFDWGGFLPMFN